MRAIILNTDYSFLSMTADWFESVCLLVRGCVTPLENYDKVVRSQYQEFQLPAVAIQKEYIQVHKKRHSFTKPAHKNIIVREKFRCAYCDTKLTLRSCTKEHVIPKSKGGKDDLLNVVAACVECNGLKADRTLRDSGMSLRDGVELRHLTEEEKLEVLMKFHDATERRAWLGFLKRTGLSLF
jgi:5-methylcytosine-specific restriction endonuclease McrA